MSFRKRYPEFDNYFDTIDDGDGEVESETGELLSPSEFGRNESQNPALGESSLNDWVPIEHLQSPIVLAHAFSDQPSAVWTYTADQIRHLPPHHPAHDLIPRRNSVDFQIRAYPQFKCRKCDYPSEAPFWKSRFWCMDCTHYNIVTRRIRDLLSKGEPTSQIELDALERNAKLALIETWLDGFPSEAGTALGADEEDSFFISGPGAPAIQENPENVIILGESLAKLEAEGKAQRAIPGGSHAWLSLEEMRRNADESDSEEVDKKSIYSPTSVYSDQL